MIYEIYWHILMGRFNCDHTWRTVPTLAVCGTSSSLVSPLYLTARPRSPTAHVPSDLKTVDKHCLVQSTCAIPMCNLLQILSSRIEMLPLSASNLMPQKSCRESPMRRKRKHGSRCLKRLHKRCLLSRDPVTPTVSYLESLAIRTSP